MSADRCNVNVIIADSDLKFKFQDYVKEKVDNCFDWTIHVYGYHLLLLVLAIFKDDENSHQRL